MKIYISSLNIIKNHRVKLFEMEVIDYYKIQIV
ncbi:MAG: hypothetical protein ACD_46C00456G0007 [uncultured bacterium]|nr:MAG: hypothetical protein ACD_46C00456G0007 [uncultured bacterium]